MRRCWGTSGSTAGHSDRFRTNTVGGRQRNLPSFNTGPSTSLAGGSISRSHLAAESSLGQCASGQPGLSLHSSPLLVLPLQGRKALSVGKKAECLQINMLV